MGKKSTAPKANKKDATGKHPSKPSPSTSETKPLETNPNQPPEDSRPLAVTTDSPASDTVTSAEVAKSDQPKAPKKAIALNKEDKAAAHAD